MKKLLLFALFYFFLYNIWPIKCPEDNYRKSGQEMQSSTAVLLITHLPWVRGVVPTSVSAAWALSITRTNNKNYGTEKEWKHSSEMILPKPRMIWIKN